ncbi:MAG: c-type cytochrome [Verrucomicrobia bacterium]|nr:c-type cytochrome [Verrucomicrobiota bacterium]MDE3098992.1 cytochrome c [Verrucomicrobiota bacterium]
MRRIIMLAAAAGFTAALTASAAGGKENWGHMCAKCHGANGDGQTNIGRHLHCKDYTDAKVQAALTDAAAIKAIKEGLKDQNGHLLMRPAKGLSDSQVKDLVAYLRTLKK